MTFIFRRIRELALGREVPPETRSTPEPVKPDHPQSTLSSISPNFDKWWSECGDEVLEVLDSIDYEGEDADGKPEDAETIKNWCETAFLAGVSQMADFTMALRSASSEEINDVKLLLERRQKEHRGEL
jgi:hypothetical protein